MLPQFHSCYNCWLKIKTESDTIMMFIEGILVLSECLLQIYTVSINKSLQGGKGKLKAGQFSIIRVELYTWINTHTYIYYIYIIYQMAID